MRQALGVVDEKQYFDLIEGIYSKNPLQCYIAIENLFKDGKEAGVIVNGFYRHLNNILITKTCKNDLSSFDFSELEIKRYSHQGSLIKGNVLLSMMDLMNSVVFGIEYSLNPQELFNKFATEAICIVKKLRGKRKNLR